MPVQLSAFSNACKHAPNHSRVLTAPKQEEQLARKDSARIRSELFTSTQDAEHLIALVSKPKEDTLAHWDIPSK